MPATISVEDAQLNLKELIHQMALGDEVVITENQQPIAKLLSQQKDPQSVRGRVLDCARG